MKESMERKEYNLQNVERRMHEYEFLLKEIAEYDSYVKLQLTELNVVITEEKEGIQITNVVHENKKLQKELEVAQGEIERLRQVVEVMTEMHENFANSDNSIADIQILNTLIGKDNEQSTTIGSSMKMS
mmetsp:Transcript_7739/g.7179  ORF Transcript_7739/g.7179 Transcript_7739/m.7179 type:complete len:129 (+) Transcript_7739:389-775(+)